MDHVARSAGLSPWDTHGPKYILLSDGTPRHDGHFDDYLIDAKGDNISTIISRVGGQMQKLSIYTNT
jgi:hypothetical protein